MVMAKNGFSECNTRNEGAKTQGEVEMGGKFSDDRGVFEKGRGVFEEGECPGDCSALRPGCAGCGYKRSCYHTGCR